MNWKYICLFNVFINYIVVLYLNFRQIKTIRNSEIPKELKSLSIINEQEFLNLKHFKYNLNFISLLVYILYLYPLLWNFSNNLSSIDNNPLKDEIVATIVFFSIKSFLSLILNFPISYYQTFVLTDEFNLKNVKLFLQDKALNVIFLVIIYIPLVTLSITVIRTVDFRYCWVYCTIIYIIYEIFIDILYPSLIKPNFLPNELIPMPDGILKQSIMDLCKNWYKKKSKVNNKNNNNNNPNNNNNTNNNNTNNNNNNPNNVKNSVNFEDDREGCDKISNCRNEENQIKILILMDYKDFEINNNDDDNQQQHLNTYCSLLNKHIVINENLIKRYDKEEILSMVAHEIGHYKQLDQIINLVIPTFNTGLFLYLLNHFIQNDMAFVDFGLSTVSLYMGLLLFSFIYSPMDTIFKSLQNHFIRQQEYQADLFSQNMMGCNQFASLLKIMTKENNPISIDDYWYSLLFNPYPTFYQRFKNLENYLKNKK
ncbi:hypothetical protein ACTA71_012034 [Dictyostelium dimigraforme]